MLFKEKLKKNSQKEIWDEYCGFLDLSMDEYMNIQTRLLDEQIRLFSACDLGRRIMGDKIPESLDEFLAEVPLTTFEDYEDVLLAKRAEMLPSEPVTWLETTWESGSKPIKTAPYSREMLDVYTRNILAAMILSTSESKGRFNVDAKAKALYGLAPLPYATGLFPMLVESEMDFRFMPPKKEAKNLSFSEQNKAGFKIAAKCGIDQFFGMSSVVYTITKNFERLTSGSSGGLGSIVGMSPTMLYRVLKAKYISKRDGKAIRPKDLFKLKGFVCVGTDTTLYKDELEEAWGMRPLEIHGGTEPTCIGTETWSKNGLVFFPDACFYEFIRKEDMLKGEKDPDFVPRTYLMNEVSANEEYEIVLTVLKGGAFMRYRPGDMYRCIRTSYEKDGLKVPQFEYVDRVPWVIDIAGFTRITEKSINKVLELSGLPVSNWFAFKEYDDDKRSFMHMYMEIKPDGDNSDFLTEKLITEQIGAYFSQYDHDYNDIKRLLGTEPLVVTLVPEGSIASHEEKFGAIRKINCSKGELLKFLDSLGQERGGGSFA